MICLNITDAPLNGLKFEYRMSIIDYWILNLSIECWMLNMNICHFWMCTLCRIQSSVGVSEWSLVGITECTMIRSIEVWF